MDTFTLTQTWIVENAVNVTKYDIVRPGYHILHSHRSVGNHGASISLIFFNSIKLIFMKFKINSFFEALAHKNINLYLSSS